MRSWSIIAAVIPLLSIGCRTSVSTGAGSLPCTVGMNECAMSLRPASFKKYQEPAKGRAYSEVDLTFFSFFKQMAPQKGGIVVVSEPFNFDHLTRAMADTASLGFMFVQDKEWPQLWTYLRGLNWEKLPFMYRDFTIYRKHNGARGMRASA